MASLRQKLDGQIEPNDPAWKAASIADRRAFYSRAGDVALERLKTQLLRGIGANGRAMKPRKRADRAAGAQGPVMSPHYDASRDIRLSDYMATDRSLTLFWHAGTGHREYRAARKRHRAGKRKTDATPFGQILEYHAEGLVRGAPKRDVRLSRASIHQVRLEMRRWWEARKKAAPVPTPTPKPAPPVKRGTHPTPTHPIPVVTKVPKGRIKGPTFVVSRKGKGKPPGPKPVVPPKPRPVVPPPAPTPAPAPPPPPPPGSGRYRDEVRARLAAAGPKLDALKAERDRLYAEWKSLPYGTDERKAVAARYYKAIDEVAGLEKEHRRLERWDELTKDIPGLIPPGPIGERIARYTAGDETVARLREIGAAGAELRSRRKALLDERQALMDGHKASGYHDDFPGKDRLRSLLSGDGSVEVQGLTDAIKAHDAKARDEAHRLVAPRNPVSFAHDAPTPHKMGTLDAIDEANRRGAREANDWLSRVVERGASPAEFRYGLGQIPKGWDQRSHCSFDGNLVALDPSEATWVHVHELGHALDARLSTGGEPVLARSLEFLGHRVGDEPLQQLNKVIPNSNYKDGEFGRKDRFEEALGPVDAWYAGKTYGTDGTEILSLGVQKFYQDPIGFAMKDPEYLKFVLGILDGSLR